MQQHVARTLRATAIAGIDLSAVHVDAVAVGHADAQARVYHHVGDEAHRGGLAVGAGHGDDGNARVIVLAEHHGYDGFAHGAATAIGGREMHAQARCGVDLDDAASLLF